MIKLNSHQMYNVKIMTDIEQDKLKESGESNLTKIAQSHSFIKDIWKRVRDFLTKVVGSDTKITFMGQKNKIYGILN